MLGAALKRFAKCEISFNRKGRTLDGFGGFVKDTSETCTHKGFINYKELEKLAVNIDDAYSEDELPILLQGNHDYLKISDTATINGLTYTVKAKRFRPFGNFTKILVKRIARRALST